MRLLLPAVVVAVLAAPSVVLADREDVERALVAMEKAVLAGDPAAYLKHVVPADGPVGDAVFRKEQENWAADLKLHVPEVFDLAIADAAAGKAENFWPDRAEFELTMSWRMPAGGTGDGPSGAGGKDRKVSYPVAFVRTGEGEWLYAGEQWITIDGETIEPDADAPAGTKAYLGTRAKAVEGLDPVAKKVIEVMPEVRAHVEEGFELKVRHTQEVKIYAEMRHLQASIYLSYSDGLGGWNEPGESIKLLARPNTGKGSLRSLLGHEFGHVATFEMGSHASDIPWWVIEGVAELSAEKFSGRDSARVARAFSAERVKNGTLAPWAEMADFRKTPDKWMGNVYKQGQAMVGYVSEKYGRAGRNAWIGAMAKGAPIGEATQKALGLSFEDLDKAWLEWLKEPVEPAAAKPAEPEKGEKPAPAEPGKP